MKRCPLVSVIVLNFNGMPYVDRCLRSVLSADYPNFEVVLVDNASSDGSLAYVEERFGEELRLKIVVNDRNYGFAEGNNIGLKYSKGEYVVFLNVDTEVDPSWLREIVKVMGSDTSVGAAQSKLLRRDDPKRIDTCGHMLTPFGFTYERGGGDEDCGQYDFLAEIFGAKGAAMAAKREVLNAVGGFDPDYFLLREETDLCWRIWLNGYRVVFIPKSVVYHVVKGVFDIESAKASSIVWHREQLFYWHRNWLMTLIKNLECTGVVKFVSIYLFLSFGDTLIGSIRNKSFYPLFSFVQSIMWVLRNFKSVLAKRLKAQGLRRLRDRVVLPRIIVRTTILGKLRERARMSLA